MNTERPETRRHNLKSALRDAAGSGRAFAVPGIFDPLGALRVEHLGFEAAFLGGWATGSHLGVTEPLMTMTETVDATARVTARTSLPLFVDAGAGWGEAVHVRRTVQELERAGAAVIQIEDQYFPKRMEYHAGIEDICDRAEFVHRVKTCVQARQSDNTLVLARTSSCRASTPRWSAWRTWRSRNNEAGSARGRRDRPAVLCGRSAAAPCARGHARHSK